MDSFLVVYVVSSNFVDGKDSCERNPNAFEVYAKAKDGGNGGQISFLDVAKSFPFEGNNLRFFVLQTITYNSEIKSRRKKRYWQEYSTNSSVKSPKYVECGSNKTIIMKICSKEQSYFLPDNSVTNSKGSGSKLTPWWLPFLPPESVDSDPRKQGVRSSVKQNQRNQSQNGNKETRRQKPTESNMGVKFPTNVSVEKGWKTFTSWAKSGISKASDMVKDMSSESVQLSSSTIRIGKKIADGGFSQVFIAQRANSSGGADQQLFALKKCLAHSKEDLKDLKNEISVHKAISCPNVLELYDYGIADSKTLSGVKEVMMLFPLLSKPGSMYDQMEGHLQGKTSSGWPYDERAAAFLMLGVCEGLKSLHKAGFIHRDLKPHNVLFKIADTRKYKSYEGDVFPNHVDLLRPVLMDLGSCSKSKLEVKSRKEALLLQDEASVKCSAPYRAPEFVEVSVNSVVDESADVWSIGCMLYAITFGKSYSPFEDPIQGVLTLAILQGNLKFPSGNRANGYTYSQKWKNLIKSIIQVKPSSRPSLDAVVQQLKHMC